MTTSPTTYTNLESLFLFQLLPKHGFLNGAFGRISDELRNTPLIREQLTYDAARLSPEALQELALRLLRDEQRREAEIAEKNAAGLSPTSKKRKLASPPLPSLEDAHRYVDKLPLLVERLYARYREGTIREIRDEEARIEGLQREIGELEKAETLELTVQAPTEKRADSNGPNAVTPSVVSEQKPALPTDQALPNPALAPPPATNATKVQDAQKLRAATSSPAPVTIAPTDGKSVQNSPSPAPAGLKPPPADSRPGPETNKQPTTSRPTSAGLSPILQHPQTAQVQVQSQVPRPSPTPSKSPLSETSSGPTTAQAPATQSPALSHASEAGQAGAAQVPSLHWEPPYQPPQSNLTPPQRPAFIPGQQKPMGFPPQVVPGQEQLPQAGPGSRQTGQQARLPANANAPHGVANAPTPHMAGQASGHHVVPGPSMEGVGRPLQQRPPALAGNSRSPAPGQTPGRYMPPHAPNSALQTPVRAQVPLQAAPPHGSAVKQGPTPIMQRPQPGRPHHALQPQPPSTPQQHQQQQQAVKGSFGSPYSQNAQLATVPRPSSAHQAQLLPYMARTPSIPRTPGGSIVPAHVVRGHGTKWVTTPTPATPRMEDVKSYFDAASPAFEPLSPPLPKAQLPKSQPLLQPHAPKIATPAPVQSVPASEARSKSADDSTQGAQPVVTPKPRGRPPRNPQKPAATTPSQSATKQTAAVGQNLETSTQRIKTEAATPREMEDVEDSTTPQSAHPTSQPSAARAANKRKREESPAIAPQRSSGPASQVLWTRSFHKVSASALEQVISHRHANMFAHAVKERDAPGYRNIVLRPQDLMGIKRAINQGSRAANQAAQSLPDFDPSTSPMNIWLPISADLVPPRGIINIAQLERELVHMFANAIMYAPDPDRGIGPAFKRRHREGSEDSSEDVLGYEVDEDGIVKDTRSMFGEVEKLLSDLRNEVDRNAPPPASGPGHSRSMSLAGGEISTAEDDADEQPGDAKRRRVRG